MHKKQMKVVLSIMAILITFALFICILFVYSNQIKATIEEESYSHVKDVTNQRNQAVQSLLQSNMESLKTIAEAIKPYSPKKKKDQILQILKNDIQHTDFLQIGLILPDGSIISTDEALEKQFPDHFQNTLKTLSGFNIIRNVENKPLLIYNTPVVYDKDNDAIIFGVMDFDSINFNHFIGESNQGQIYSTMIDSNLNTIASMPKQNGIVSFNQIFQSLSKNAQEAILHDINAIKANTLAFRYQNIKYIMHYTPIEINNCYFVSIADSNTIATQSKFIYKSTFLFLLIGFTAFFIILFVVYRSLSKSNRKIQKTKLEFETVMSNIPGGVVEFFYDDNLTMKFMNDGLSKLIQFTKAEIETELNNSFLNLIHDSDREQLASAIVDQMTTKKTVEIDCRLRRKDGSFRWFLFTGRAIANTDQNPTCLCVLTDITDKKQVQHELSMHMQRYRIVTEQSDSIIYEYNFLDNSVYLSDKWDTKFSFNSKQPNFIEKAKQVNLVHPDDLQAFLQMIDALKNGLHYSECEIRLAKMPEKYIWCRIKASTVFDENNVACKIVGKIIDIDQQKRETDMLKQKAENDSLTGLYNKVTTSMLIDNYLQHEGKNGKHTLMFLDIDNFKAVNDTLGHLVGDAVILEITTNLKKIIRSSDICGRVGGDEFVILLKNTTNMEIVQHKIDEICNAFRQTVCSQDTSIDISGSIGVAFYDIDGTTFNELANKADTALYEAKKRGKNQYVFYTHSPQL